MIDLIDICGAVIIFASLGLGWCTVDILYVKPQTRRRAVEPQGDMLPGKFDMLPGQVETLLQFNNPNQTLTPNETRKDRSWIQFETRTWGGKLVKTLQDTYKAQGEWVGLATERPETTVWSSAAPASELSAEIRNLPAVVTAVNYEALRRKLAVLAVEQHTESISRSAYISPEIELQD